MLNIVGTSKWFGTVKALDDCSFAVACRSISSWSDVHFDSGSSAGVLVSHRESSPLVSVFTARGGVNEVTHRHGPAQALVAVGRTNACSAIEPRTLPPSRDTQWVVVALSAAAFGSSPSPAEPWSAKVMAVRERRWASQAVPPSIEYLDVHKVVQR